MVCVEDHDEFAVRLREGMVQVARLGMLARALDIGRPEPFSQPADFFSVAVVQHVYPLVSLLHRGGSDQGFLQNLAGLGVDRNKDVD